MRVNEPITANEIPFPEGAILVSGTDPGGRITFANKAFVDMSGYALEELIGAPHNLIRHPHMPKEAFADLWHSIQAGRPWEGYVKNRAKSGDFYWVKANVTPQIENGKIVGYVSIRSKPEREAVRAVEPIYAKFREGKAGGLKIQDGGVIKTGALTLLGAIWNTMIGRIITGFALIVALMITSAVTGLMGMNDSNAALRTVYEDRTVPAGQLAHIGDAIRDNVLQIALMESDLRKNDTTKLRERAQKVRRNTADIDKTWGEYMATYLTPEEAVIARAFAEQRKAYVEGALGPAMASAESGDVAALSEIVAAKVLPGFDSVYRPWSGLIDLQLRIAKEEFEAQEKGFRKHFVGEIVSISVAVLVALFFAFNLTRNIRGPLSRLGRYFGAIAGGDYTLNIPDERIAEYRRPVRLLRALRAKLAFAQLEKVENDRRADAERKAAILEMADTVEKETTASVDVIANSTRKVNGSAEDMAGKASEVTENCQAASEAANTALASAQAVSSAAEQLSASIGEISSQVGKASAATGEAVKVGAKAEETIGSLSEAVAKISEVTKLIGQIAGQTNLLALNATIEAARAGAAGKGFAVVASEVKNLANQTARSTEDINRQVEEIQAATKAAVEAVAAIGAKVLDIDSVAQSISAAVEEQGAATKEIARNVSQTADAVNLVTTRIGDVTHEAAAVTDLAADVRKSVGGVNDNIESLKNALVKIVRTSTAEADRRMHRRQETDIAAKIVLDGRMADGRIVDISMGGASLRTAQSPAVGANGRLEFDGLSLAFEVRAVEGGDVRVAFNGPREEIGQIEAWWGRRYAA